MATSKATSQPPIARRFIWYLSSFMVSVAVGLAPFLGTAKVPGFRALLDLFPLQLQDDLIPVSAFLMGLIAVAVHFYSTEKVRQSSLNRWFRLGFICTLSLLLILFVLYKLFVVRVLIPDLDRTVAVLVGWSSPQANGCCKGVRGLKECITTLSLDEAIIEACFGDREIAVASLLLSLPYLAITGGVGALVGLIILREQMRRDRRRPSGTATKENV